MSKQHRVETRFNEELQTIGDAAKETEMLPSTLSKMVKNRRIKTVPGVKETTIISEAGNIIKQTWQPISLVDMFDLCEYLKAAKRVRPSMHCKVD